MQIEKIETHQSGTAFVEIPRKPGQFLWRFLIWTVEKVMGHKLLPARVLLWYPKALIGSAVLESLVAHNVKSLGRRILKLVRLQTAFSISCPFCADMNAVKYDKFHISDDELLALQGKIPVDTISTFSKRELIALEYARSASASPLSFTRTLIEQLKENFSDREIVILSSTVAQVNYWGRLIQALGIPPAGFSAECSVLNLDDFTTLKG